MRHVPDGTLRRLIDEPFAVADRDARHVEGCARCRARSQRIAEDATIVNRFFEVPVPADTDAGLARSRASLLETPSRRTTWRVGPRRSWRLMGASLGTGASVAAVGVVIVGVTAAATLTTVFAPTQVAPGAGEPGRRATAHPVDGAQHHDFARRIQEPFGCRDAALRHAELVVLGGRRAGRFPRGRRGGDRTVGDASYHAPERRRRGNRYAFSRRSLRRSPLAPPRDLTFRAVRLWRASAQRSPSPTAARRASTASGHSASSPWHNRPRPRPARRRTG